MNNKKTNITLSAIAARFTALLLILTMASCTLSMEDWVETEENKGYDELVTEENDFYSVKYQYKDYTRSITDQIREYIVSVEADSVIYFLDNLPEEWTPQVGGCVVANCCTTFPMGLLARVLDVEKEAGMIKVTTTPCRLEDAYEDFELDMDMDVMSSKNPQMKSTTRSACSKTRGEDGPDSIISTIDWTMFNLLSKDEKVKCIDGNITRADDDEFYDQDIDSDTTTENEIPLFELNTDNEPLKTIAKKVKFPGEASISAKFVNVINIKKKLNVKSDYEYTKQHEKSGIKIEVSAGTPDITKFTTKARNEAERAERADSVFNVLLKNGSIILTDPLPIVSKLEESHGLLIEIPLPSLPFGFLIRLRPIIEYSVSIIGSGEVVLWFSNSVVETTISNGEKIEKEPQQLKSPSPEVSSSIVGKASFTAGAELFLGFGKKILGALEPSAIGLGVAASFEVNAEAEANFAWDWGCLDGSLDCGVTITADATVGAKALGGRWGEYDFLTKEFRVWDGPSWKFYPSVSVNDDIPIVYHENADEKYKEIKVTYTYKNLGFFASFTKSYFHPRLRIYRGTDLYGNESYIDLEPDNKPSHVEKGEPYTFTYKTIEIDQDFTVVPLLYYEKGVNHSTFFTDNVRYLDKNRKPIVQFYHSDDRSVKGDRTVYLYKTVKLKDDDPLYQQNAIQSGLTLYAYDFCLPFRIHNATNMADYWSDFGIKYMVYLDNIAEGRYQSLFNKIKKSKPYAPHFTVVTDKYFNYSSRNYVKAQLYYVNKDDPKKEKHYFNEIGDWMFCWSKYLDSDYELGDADVLLYDRAKFMFYEDKRETWDWEEEFSKDDFLTINYKSK